MVSYCSYNKDKKKKKASIVLAHDVLCLCLSRDILSILDSFDFLNMFHSLPCFKKPLYLRLPTALEDYPHLPYSFFKLQLIYHFLREVSLDCYLPLTRSHSLVSYALPFEHSSCIIAVDFLNELVSVLFFSTSRGFKRANYFCFPYHHFL